MTNLSHWTKSNEEAELILVIVSVSCECIEHLSSTHRMSYVGDLFLASLLDNVINHSFIIQSHVLPWEVIELLFINIWVILLVSQAIGVTTWVTKPYIVTCSGSNKSWRFTRIVHYPTVSRVEKAVLHEDRWSTLWINSFRSWNSENC